MSVPIERSDLLMVAEVRRQIRAARGQIESHIFSMAGQLRPFASRLSAALDLLTIADEALAEHLARRRAA